MTKDKEKNRLAAKRSREKHPETRKIYNKTHKERLNAECRTYRQTHKEEIRAYNNKWIKDNPDKMRDRRRRKRAQRRKTQIESINERRVYLRDGWICQICRKKVNHKLKYPNLMCASLDHIIPLSQGGTHTYSNIQLTHWICNIKKNVNVLPQGEQLRWF